MSIKPSTRANGIKPTTHSPPALTKASGSNSKEANDAVGNDYRRSPRDGIRSDVAAMMEESRKQLLPVVAGSQTGHLGSKQPCWPQKLRPGSGATSSVCPES